MWGGRFQAEVSALFKSFNDSLPVDYQLLEQDITGSLAWADALQAAGVLTAAEAIQLKQALQDILQDYREQPEAVLGSGAEDIHSWVEQELVTRIGSLGKKLHTGRSRNDQVLTDLKLWCKRQAKQLRKVLKKTIVLLNEKSIEYADAVMPSYTHLQRAQPITFGFWLDAAAHMLLRDVRRLEALTQIADECPLGASAIAGTAFQIDRDQLAVHLGFAQATQNALDTVSDRDFVLDLLYCGSSSLLHLSRLAEDLIFFNTQEAAFIVLDDSVTSGSSLMPQKKNPDALELIRGKSAEGYAMLSQMMMAVKSLPLGYNKDLQQDKAALFQAMSSWQMSLTVFHQVIASLRVNKPAMRQAVENSFSNATELADYLVHLGVPFRDAHEQTGRLVLAAEKQACYLHQLPLATFQAINPAITEDVFLWLDNERAIARRQVKGGVGNHSLSARSLLEYRMEPATLADVEGIYRLILYWSKQGETLPRSREDISNQLASFRIIKNQSGQIIGCGGLHIYDDRLVEIRSLSLMPEHHGKGLGRRLVYALLAAAREMHLQTAFVLTRAPKFFSSCDFEVTSIDLLPKKILKDCQFCPRKASCDEVAMIYDL